MKRKERQQRTKELKEQANDDKLHRLRFAIIMILLLNIVMNIYTYYSITNNVNTLVASMPSPDTYSFILPK